MYPQIVFVRDKMPVLIDRAKELQILSPHWVSSIGKEAKFISTLEEKLVRVPLVTLFVPN